MKNAVLLVIVSMALCACGGGGNSAAQSAAAATIPTVPTAPAAPTVDQSPVGRDLTPQVSSTDLTAVETGNTEFALNSFPLLDPGSASNTVYSPYSVTQA